MLAITNRTDECRLIQVFGCLEKAQMLIAIVKTLNVEEDRVTEVDDAALMKTEADKARLAPQLECLHTACKDFTQFLANIPRETVEGDIFAAY